MADETRKMAQDGHDITSPSAMPSGGYGIMGWLSAIYTAISSLSFDSGRLQVDATVNVETVDIAEVHLADPITDTKANVKSDGTNDALVVVMNELPAGTHVIGKVEIDQTTPGTTDKVTVSTSQGAGATIGATSDAAVVTDTTGTVSGKLRGLVKLLVDKITVKLDTGSNIVGKVGIDQTTPGTTDSVTLSVAQGAGQTIGGLADAALIDDSSGSISGKLRGLVRYFYTVLKSYGGGLFVISQPYLYSVAEGDITGHYILRKLGRAPSVSTSQIDVCGMNAVIPMIASAMQMSVKSTSANDDGSPAGSGAQIVSIDYLDGSYAAKTVDVTLDGTTWADTSATDIFRIQSFHVKAVGAGGYAAGSITLVDKATRAIVYDQIDVGYNRSMRAMWTVPAGKTAYISSWGVSASSGASKGAEFILKAMVHEGVLSTYWFGHDIMMVQDGSSQNQLQSPIVVPATASIKISVKGAGSLSAVASFAGWYE